MDVITFEFIREIHRKEKEKKGLELETLPENFFSLVQQWLNEKEKLYENTRNPEILLEIENAKKLLRELIIQRQKKIVISALQVMRGGLPPEHMTQKEEEMFEKILSVLNEYKSTIELEITGEFIDEKIKDVKKELKELEMVSIENKEMDKAVKEEVEEKVEKKEEKYLKEKEEKIEEAPAEKKIRVIALSNIPRFVDENLNSYGPYKKGEEFEVPEELAKIMISRNVVKEVIE